MTHVSWVSCIGRWVLYHWCHLEIPYLQGIYLIILVLIYKINKFIHKMEKNEICTQLIV